MQQEPVVKRQSVIDAESDSWIESIMTGVWQMLEDQCDGAACITTPSGRACRIWVTFGKAGSA